MYNIDNSRKLEIIIRILAALLAIGWTSDAQATPNATIIGPPNCYNNSTEKVEFINSSPDRHRFATSMARRDGDGMPVIFFSLKL